MLDGDDVVYVARVATRRIMSVGIAVGTRFPAYATSMGRVLLAGLDDAELDAYFARTDRTRLTPTTLVDEGPLRQGSAASASRAGPTSTKARDRAALARRPDPRRPRPRQGLGQPVDVGRNHRPRGEARSPAQGRRAVTDDLAAARLTL